MTRELLQQALDALTVIGMNYAISYKHWPQADAAITALREALAAPMPEPVAWYLPSPDGDDSIFRDHRTVIACTGNKWEGFLPLYAAPPAEQCYCDRMGIGVPGVSCGDCPTRDYKPAAPTPVVPLTDTRKLCTCDGAGRGPGRECVVKAGGRLGDLWRCARGIGGGGNG